MNTVGILQIQMMADMARLSKDMGDAKRIVGGAVKDIEKAAMTARNALGSLGVGFGLAQIVQMTDRYTKYTSQLKLVTQSTAEYGRALSDVRRISTAAQADTGLLGILYARVTNATRELGLSQDRVASITETVGLALKVSGATATESASAMLQLSQAFGSGLLRGEEFNAVNEASPRIMQVLAASMGVQVGQLRELASQGKITSAVMAKAFSDPAVIAGLREQAKEVQTIQGAFTVLGNKMVDFVGQSATGSGGVALLSGAVMLLADNIGTVVNALMVLVGFKVTLWAQGVMTRMIETSVATRAAALATREAAAANVAKAEADVAATASSSALAAARVRELQAAVLATDGAVSLAIATNGLVPANARAAAAETAHAAALTRLTAAQAANAAANTGMVARLGASVASFVKANPFLVIVSTVAAAIYAINALFKASQDGLDNVVKRADAMRLDELIQARQELIVENAARRDSIFSGFHEREIRRNEDEIRIYDAKINKLKATQGSPTTTPVVTTGDGAGPTRMQRIAADLNAAIEADGKRLNHSQMVTKAWVKLKDDERTAQEALNYVIAQQAAMELDTIEAPAKDAAKLLDAMNERLRIMQDLARGLSSAFGDAGASVGSLFEAYAASDAKLAEVQLRFAEATQGMSTASAEFKDLQVKYSNEAALAQVSSYGDMAHAAQGFFDQGSDGYKVLGAVEKAYRLMQLAMSIQAMAMGKTETASSVADSTTKATASTVAGVAKAFEELGIWGFVGAAAILAFMASVGAKVSGGGSAPTMTGTIGSGGTNAQMSNGAAITSAQRNRLEYDTKQLHDTYVELGLALGDSEIATREWSVSVGDVEKEMGNQLIPGLEAFRMEGETLAQTARRLTDALAAAEDAYQKVVSAEQAKMDKAEQAALAARAEALKAIAAVRDTAQSIRDFAATLGAKSIQTTAANYQNVLALAQSGDVAAQGKLQGAAGDYLTKALSTARTAADYERIVAQVKNDLVGTADSLSTQADIAQQQLDVLTASTDWQKLIADNTANTGNNILNLADKMAEFSKLIAEKIGIDQGAVEAIGGAEGERSQTVNELENQLAIGVVSSAQLPAYAWAYWGAAGITGMNTLTEYQKQLEDAAAAGKNLDKFKVAAKVSALMAWVHNPSDSAWAAYDALPAYAVGTNYVPQDGLAFLHRGEAVVPAAQNTGAPFQAANDEGVRSELTQLRSELRAIGASLARNTGETANILRRFDGDGMPAERVITA